MKSCNIIKQKRKIAKVCKVVEVGERLKGNIIYDRLNENGSHTFRNVAAVSGFVSCRMQKYIRCEPQKARLMDMVVLRNVVLEEDKI
ncbi:MAG: hypothetical protein V3U02_02360 [Calditrichia bacterium]